MVDPLSHVGKFDKAQIFIDKMSVKPNVGIWVSLLAACRVYTNMKLGRHILRSNFYAATTDGSTWKK